MGDYSQGEWLGLCTLQCRSIIIMYSKEQLSTVPGQLLAGSTLAQLSAVAFRKKSH